MFGKRVVVTVHGEDCFPKDIKQLIVQSEIELPFAHREHIGCTVDYVAGRNRYMGYLISLGIYSFKGVKVGLDCANGSSWNIAKSVFDALGADTYHQNGMNKEYPMSKGLWTSSALGVAAYADEIKLFIDFIIYPFCKDEDRSESYDKWYGQHCICIIFDF